MIGVLLSYIYPYSLDKRLKSLFTLLYSAWLSQQFKFFKGQIKGRIRLRGPKYISVGEGSRIEKDVQLLATDSSRGHNYTPEVIIGKNSAIQRGCFISAINKIEIGDGVAVTDYTMILDNVHGDFRDDHFTFNENPDIPDVFLQEMSKRELVSSGPVLIEDNVHIGMFSLILPKTHIGHNSVVAAHSVVSGRIPPYSLVAGNPARIIMTFGKKKKSINQQN